MNKNMKNSILKLIVRGNNINNNYRRYNIILHDTQGKKKMYSKILSLSGVH